MTEKNPAAVALGSIRSERKARTSVDNGKKGGRPITPGQTVATMRKDGTMTTNSFPDTIDVIATQFPRGTKYSVFGDGRRLYSTFSVKALFNWLLRNGYPIDAQREP